MNESLNDFFTQISGKEEYAYYLVRASYSLFLLMLSALSYFISRNIILKLIDSLVKRTKTNWDDVIVKKRVFHKLARIVPALVIYFFIVFVFPNNDILTTLIRRVMLAYMVLMSIFVLSALLDAFLEIYQSLSVSEKIPIKVYVQLVKIFLYIVSVILVIAVLMNRSPWVLLSGIGAMTAVLMLVFKDSILGFVASIQINMNEMAKIGDWIEVPAYGADGDIIDMTLHTIKVQNFDKTIVTFPTYALVSGSFKNWRGMKESGGRRIKRAVYIDINSIKFLDEETIARFRKYEYIKNYIDKKLHELNEYNMHHDVSERVNGRRLTNIGTFRAYLIEYLKHHPMIESESMTFLVRQLPPSERGVPIEIYVFCKDKVWANYESIQADIFDHIFAVVPEFSLRLFQNPSGSDFSQLLRSK